MRNVYFVCLLATVAVWAEDTVPGTAVATVNGHVISANELHLRVGNLSLNARTEEYGVRRVALEQLIDAALLSEEAAKSGVSTAELLRAQVSPRVRPVSPDEARTAYEAMHPSEKAPPSPEALKRLANSINAQRASAATAEYVAELRRGSRVEVLLDPPRAAFPASERPSHGPADATVTIVEFSDFQCPYCAAATKTIRQLKAAYGDKLRIVYRNFPIPSHPDAQSAAEAAMCAGRQGRFWEMHDKLFGNQTSLAAGDLRQYAVELDLDSAAFERCVANHEMALTIAEDKAAGVGAGVTGTPAFFVNGRPVYGAASAAKFTGIIDEEFLIAERARLSAALASQTPASR